MTRSNEQDRRGPTPATPIEIVRSLVDRDPPERAHKRIEHAQARLGIHANDSIHLLQGLLEAYLLLYEDRLELFRKQELAAERRARSKRLIGGLVAAAFLVGGLFVQGLWMMTRADAAKTDILAAVNIAGSASHLDQRIRDTLLRIGRSSDEMSFLEAILRLPNDGSPRIAAAMKLNEMSPADIAAIYQFETRPRP